ncbi:hypothetical protein [Candidimonas sp. SYP-B2681]|uniref:hypothetical protein n=1 Tax=Candidimonas sp. SYP-B2681 TaxID=2497686 RepID=UPI001F333530|nr:hypothetical protein [Candidimonas sp. SYP-B2681]
MSLTDARGVALSTANPLSLDRYEEALALFNSYSGDPIAIDYPRDILAMQVAHIGNFLLGQSTMLRDRIARALPQWSEQEPGFGYILGMYAFGLEETILYEQAELAALQYFQHGS